MPRAVVGSGVDAVRRTRKAEAGSVHGAAHEPSGQRVVNLGGNGLEVFALYGEVENRLCAVMVEEAKLVFVGNNAVGTRHRAFGQHPFVAALLAFGLGQRSVAVAPALVAERCPDSGLSCRECDEHNGLLDIHP